MLSFIIGLVGIIFGFFLIWKADWIVENIGRTNWAEEHLGSEGGSRIFYKLIGLGVIILGFLFMFGFVGDIVTAIFKPITPGLKSSR
ncbi:MAG: hypothetical protein ACOY0S_01155 [Patescibacteria group bacterium]